MPIPAFDEMGLLPAGIHDCTLDEIEARFVWNPQRSAVWTKCRGFLKELAGMKFVSPIIVDGGFVTDKDDPADIDLSPDLRAGAADAEVKDALFLFALRRQEIKEKHCVDFCPSLPGNSDFTQFFQYVRLETIAKKKLPPSARKGILRVMTWAHL